MFKRLKAFILAAAIAAAACGALCAPASAANTTNIYSFPESYRTMVARLMELYPQWVFMPIDTGLDFSAAVMAEANGSSSLVESGVSSWFKSKSAGCYNPESGNYISKDSGWVAANPAAVAYFMDPRNLLTEKLAFQFESLSYDSIVHTEDGVEKILAGSFMSHAALADAASSGAETSPGAGSGSQTTVNYGQKPEDIIALEKEGYLLNYGTYVCDVCWKYFSDFSETSDGLYCPFCGELLISYYGEWSESGVVDGGGSASQPAGSASGLTYAQAIMNASKQNGVSPYYIASKIITEIGKTRSTSVTGTNSEYPGIYNFYNIGATSGANAAVNGLAWASSGSTYQRPWNTEERSIMGGAEFIAEKYIAKGQNTIYYQRFNVSPRSSYDKYTHQYMTSTYSASTEARATYNAYSGIGTLSDAKIFFIPVYNNMPDKSAALSFTSGAATGTASSNAILRAGADVNALQMKTVPSGTALTIYSGAVTTAEYGSSNFLRFPYWYKVGCTIGGVNYSGYICADYVSVDTGVTVAAGESYKLSCTLTSSNPSEAVYYESTDYTVASVSSGGVVTGVKDGSCVVYAYTGGGAMAAINVKVGQSGTGTGSESGSEKPTGGGTVVPPANGDYSTGTFSAFTDVSGHRDEQYIKYAVYYNLYKGTSDTTFSPEAGMTRGMFVTVLGRLAGIDTEMYLPDGAYGVVNTDLARMRSGPSTDTEIAAEKALGTRLRILGVEGDWYHVYDGSKQGYIRSDLLDGVSYTESFTDVDASQYYAPYIRWASETDTIHGYGDGLFGPNDQISREQMAIVAYNYAAKTGVDVSGGNASVLSGFSDGASIHDWARTQVAWAVSQGIAEGKNGGSAYEPVSDATRAEVAAVMAKFMMKYMEVR